MVTALFCSENWIKTRTPINANVDVSLIVPFLVSAQDLWIQPIVGTALYDRLMAGIVASNLTADETALLDLLRPALAYFTLSTALPFVATQVRNGGVVKTKSDQTEPASKAEVDALKAAAQNMAEFYAERATRYLCANASAFPLYSSSDDMQASGTTNYNAGFYFPDSSCGCDIALDGTGCSC